MKNNKMEDGLVSMTETLCDSLYVKELESRLETDPLVAGGLVEFVSDSAQLGCFIHFCGSEGCGELTCQGKLG